MALQGWQKKNPQVISRFEDDVEMEVKDTKSEWKIHLLGNKMK